MFSPFQTQAKLIQPQTTDCILKIVLLVKKIGVQ